MKKSLRTILWRVLTCGIVVGMFVLLYSTYTHPVRKIGTTDILTLAEAAGEDLTDFVSGGFPALEEDGRTLWVDDGGVVWVTDDETEEILWRNAADDFALYVEGNEEAACSPVGIQYQFEGEQTVDMYSTIDVEEGNCQIAYDEDETCLRVTYLFGDTGASGILPLALTVEYMEETVLPILSESDKDYLLRRYELVTPEDATSTMKAEIPGILEQPLYYLKDCSQLTKQKKTISILSKAAITEEIYEKQCAVTGEVQPTRTENYLITVEYWLEDGDLVVNVPCDEIKFHPDNPMTHIKLNGYATYAERGDGFYLLPVGSGVLQSFVSEMERNNTYRYMGETFEEKETVVLAGSTFPLPIYGVSRTNECGMIALIEQGAELAFLNEKYTNQASVLSTSFQILEFGDASIHQQNTSTLFGYEVYRGDIRVRYRFLEPGADYNEMAKVCRAMLIERDMLAEKPQIHLSGMIEFVGNVKRDIQWMNLLPVTQTVPLTTYAQTEQIVERLSAAGLDNLGVKLAGYYEAGLFSQIPGKYDWSKSLGTEQERLALFEYLAKNGILTFADVNLAYYYQQKNNILSGYSSNDKSAKTLNNAPAVREIVNESNKKTSTRAGQIHLIAPWLYETMATNTSTVLDKRFGVSLGDSLNCLTVDFNAKRYADRAIAFEKLNNAVKIYSEERMVMGQNVPATMLNHVAVVEHMATYPELSVGYSASIPFVQLVLHGHVVYTSPTLNGSPDYKHALLEAVETGCIPHYAIVGAFDSDIMQTEYDFMFYLDQTKWMEIIQADLTRFQRDMSDLLDIEIRDHVVEGNVRIVTYENGAVVYVNYGDSAIDVNNVTVPANDYLRVF